MARERVGGAEAAVALHEAQLHAPQPRVEAALKGAQVLDDVRCEVGVRGGREAPWYHFDHLHDLVTQGDVRKAHVGSDPADQRLVVGEKRGVLEDDGNGLDAGGLHTRQRLSHRRLLQRHPRAHALAGERGHGGGVIAPWPARRVK